MHNFALKQVLYGAVPVILMTQINKFVLKLPPLSLSVICLAAIVYLTLVPHPLPDNDLGLIPGMDKIVHAVMFFGLALCLAIDLKRRGLKRESDRINRFLPPMLSAVAGGVIEIIQMAMGIGRSGDILDFVADTAGAFLSLTVIPIVFRWLFGHSNR